MRFSNIWKQWCKPNRKERDFAIELEQGLLPSGQAPKVTRQGLQLVPHPLFLHFDHPSLVLGLWTILLRVCGEIRDVLKVRVPWKIVGDVGGNSFREFKQLGAIDGYDIRKSKFRMLDDILRWTRVCPVEVRWPTPWRTEEYDVDGSFSPPRFISSYQCSRKLDKVPKDKLDPVGNTVDSRIVSRESQPRRIIVDRDNAFASPGKRYCVSTHPAKCVDDGMATTPLGDLVRDELRGNAVPSNAIEETALVIEGEVSVPLGEI